MKREMVECPQCKVHVRADRLEKHLQTIHNPTVPPKIKHGRRKGRKSGSVVGLSDFFLSKPTIPEWDYD